MRYLNKLYNNAMLPTISTNTREKYKDVLLAASSIDHVSIKLHEECSSTSAVIEDKISDHYMVVTQLCRPNANANGNIEKTWNIINKVMEKKVRDKTEEVLQRNFKTNNLS